MRQINLFFRSLLNLSKGFKLLIIFTNAIYVVILVFKTANEVGASGFLSYVINLVYSINAGAVFYILTVHFPQEKRRDLTFKLINNLLIEVLELAAEPLMCLGHRLTLQNRCIEFNVDANFRRSDFDRLFSQIDLRSTPLPRFRFLNSPVHPNFIASLSDILPKIEKVLNIIHHYNQSFDEILSARISSLQDNMNKLSKGYQLGVGPWLVHSYFELWFDANQAFRHLRKQFRRNMRNFHYYAIMENKQKYN
jgi:hypothetical protein